MFRRGAETRTRGACAPQPIANRNATDHRSLSANLEDFHGRGIDETNSRHSRDEIRRALGAGRSLKLQTSSKRASIFHAQRSTRADRLRDFSEYDAASSATTGRWNAGAG